MVMQGTAYADINVFPIVPVSIIAIEDCQRQPLHLIPKRAHTVRPYYLLNTKH